MVLGVGEGDKNDTRAIKELTQSWAMIGEERFVSQFGRISDQIGA